METKLTSATEQTSSRSQDETCVDERLHQLWEETGDRNLRRLSRGEDPIGVAPPRSTRDREDVVSSCLMDCYKRTGNAAAFDMLSERNRGPFMRAIRAQLRRCGGSVEAEDVLQESFLNIYRYPRKFVCERPESFRNWGNRIVRNTLWKLVKKQSRSFCGTEIEEGVVDPAAKTPHRAADDSETAGLVDFVYLTYLNLYVVHYEALSAKEQRALHMVEIDGATYRTTALELGISFHNLKMVIFRARRKILRNVEQSFQSLAGA